MASIRKFKLLFAIYSVSVAENLFLVPGLQLGGWWW